MKFTLVAFACILVAASAQQYSTGQYNRNQYDPFSYYNRNQYNRQYNQNGQYNRYNRYNVYQPFSTKAPYKPWTFSTPAPSTAAPATAAPSTAAPATAAPVTFVPYSFAPVTSTAAPVTAAPVNVVPVVRVSADASNAETVRYGNEINPDGSFNYFFETQNGIAAQEQGVPRNFGGDPPLAPVVTQGSFSWTSPEGQPILITYTADENGYQPSGDSLPVPPALPAQIARALEYTAKYHVAAPQQ